MKRIAFGIALSLCFVHANCQTMGNPAGMLADTPGINQAQPDPDHSNVQDKLFVRQAALGGRAEVELGRLAQKKASAESVKNFAQRMIEDHGKSNDRLLRVGRDVNSQIPKELDPEHKRVQSELQQMNGEDFDIAYLTHQIGEHQKTANLLQWEISYGQNQELTKYAIDTLPGVMEHLEVAKDELAKLTSGVSDERQAREM